MAGQPKWAAFLARMEEIDGIDIICMSIVAGKKIRAIAKELQTSRTTIYRYINHTPDNAAAFREARRIGAAALAEEGLQIIDDADENSSSAVSKAREQAGYRKWLAGVQNREEFGPPQQAALVQVNLGDALLGALQQHGGPSQITEGGIPEGECELIEGGADDAGIH